jgi:hypothetical protein
LSLSLSLSSEKEAFFFERVGEYDNKKRLAPYQAIIFFFCIGLGKGQA